MKLAKRLVVLDLETTGTWIDKDKIIEIAMIKVSPDGSKELFDRKVNPEIPIPPVVSQLVGITDADLRLAPKFAEIAKEVLAFISGCDLGGFNIARFDLPLLKREVNEAGLKHDWDNIKVYDAQRVFHLNEKRDLAAAYSYYCGKNLENAHSAMADTEATLAILDAQVATYGAGDNKLESLNRFKYLQTAEFLDRERKFRWWNGKAYMMFGKYAKNYSLQEIVDKDPGYLEWILSAKFSDEVKSLVADALQGRFPVFEMRESPAFDDDD